MKMTAVSRVMRVMVIFKLKAEISQIQMLSEDHHPLICCCKDHSFEDSRHEIERITR